MIQGTTPTHTFRLPFDTSLLSSARVVYKQGQTVVLRKGTEAFAMEENILRVALSQEETLRFDCKLSVKIQLRVKTKTGQVLAMKPRIVPVDECLDAEVLT